MPPFELEARVRCAGSLGHEALAGGEGGRRADHRGRDVLADEPSPRPLDVVAIPAGVASLAEEGDRPVGAPGEGVSAVLVRPSDQSGSSTPHRDFIVPA